jgi:hypothetical protein
MTELSPLGYDQQPGYGRPSLAVTFPRFQHFSEGALVAKPQTTKGRYGRPGFGTVVPLAAPFPEFAVVFPRRNI